MKSIFLNNETDLIKVNNLDSFPEIIRLGQFSTGLNISKDTFLINVDGKNRFSYESNGNMANSNFDIFLDCRHWSIPYENETAAFKWVNDNLKERKYPTFRKKELFEKFFILEIPDYGHQSMSFAYRDFVPHIFINGCKLWNRYVGTIKHFSKKVAYLLIDKNENNLSIAPSDETRIDIRICFKNNIETEHDANTQHSVKFEMRDCNVDENGCQYYSFEGKIPVYDNLNLTDFDFFIKNDNAIYPINPIIFDSLTIENVNKYTGNDKGTLIIDRQSGGTRDYFKQGYFKDYYHKDDTIYNIRKKDFDRNINAKVTLRLNHNCNINLLQDSHSILVQSKNEHYSAIYEETNTDVFTNSKFLSTSNYIFYDRSGKLIKKVDWYFKEDTKKRSFYKFLYDPVTYQAPFTDLDLSNFECVPEYNSKRRIQFSVDFGKKEPSELTLKNFLFNINEPESVYRWHLVDPEILYYNNAGEFCREKNITYENIIKNGSYLIYDRGEPLFNPFVDKTLSKNILTDYSFTYWPNLPVENDDRNYNLNKLTASRIDLSSIGAAQGRVVPLNYIPASFYLYLNTKNQDITTSLLKNIKISVFIRSFLVEYSSFFYDGRTLYFTLPPYILKNLNRDIMNATESNLYVDVLDNVANDLDAVIYDMTHVSEEKFLHDTFRYTENDVWNSETNRNKAFDSDKGIYTMNILNYAMRNDPIVNTEIQNKNEPTRKIVKDERFENTYQLYLEDPNTSFNYEVGKNKNGYSINIKT